MLKPCLLCGGKAIFTDNSISMLNSRDWIPQRCGVACVSCNLSLPPVYETKDAAASAWNTRPSERLVDELIEACGQMLDIINESQGIVGWHLNGDVLLWSQCEQVQMMEDAVAAARAALTGKGE